MSGVRRRSTFVGAMLVLVTATSARADAPKITAVLTSSETSLGTPVQLQITVSGNVNVAPPDSIRADGLDIRFTGKSQNFEMLNFRTSSSVTLNYTVMPTKPGKFKIPPQSLRVGAATLQTPELTLQVLDSGSRSAGTNNARAQRVGDDRLAFAELVVPKKTAYVGEIIPVVARVGFTSRGRFADMEPPHIEGQGFVIQKLSEPEKNLETIGGRSFIVYTYKTAVSAARAGNFSIGPVELTAVALVPRRSSGTRRMPFDPFGEDDPFSDPFLLDPFSAFAERRRITIKSEPVPLEVKPLPPGAPPAFGGAVGNFSLSSEANPKRIQIGDPITLNIRIGGRGNFDRVNAPVLAESSGWHTYPPSAKFKQDDDIGLSGEKTFEMVVSPTEKQSNIPPLLFAYFDPLKEKYVTLQTESVPITVEGNPQPTPVVAAGSPAVGSPASASTPPDILHQIDEPGRIVHSFAPIYARRDFWLAQIVPLLAAVGLFAWKKHRALLSNRAALRAARLHHEADDLLRKLRRDDLGPREYFSSASRIVQLKTAVKEDVEPGAVDAETASRAFNLDDERSERLRVLFATSDELRYSGSANGAISPERRQQALELIESLP